MSSKARNVELWNQDFPAGKTESRCQHVVAPIVGYSNDW